MDTFGEISSERLTEIMFLSIEQNSPENSITPGWGWGVKLATS